MTDTFADTVPAAFPAAFVDALAEALPTLGHRADLLADLPAELELRSLGMDSLATLRVLLALEAAFDISVPDEDLSVATFATPAALWRAVAPLLDVPAP